MNDVTPAHMMAVFFGSWGASMKAQADHHAGLMARQGDYAAQDNRLITAAVMNELFTGTGPSKLAALQTASHAPTAQPYVVPNFVTPAGKVPA